MNVLSHLVELNRKEILINYWTHYTTFSDIVTQLLGLYLMTSPEEISKKYTDFIKLMNDMKHLFVCFCKGVWKQRYSYLDDC